MSSLVQIIACLAPSYHQKQYFFLLSIGILLTNFSEILIEIQNISFTKMHLKTSSAKWRPSCPRRDELNLPAHVRDLILVITVPADDLTSPSARTVLSAMLHRKPRVIMVPTLPSLATVLLVVMTTFGVASDDKVGTMTTLGFQCRSIYAFFFHMVHMPSTALIWPVFLQMTPFKMAHDDVIKWKHFPCYWPFVRGIHRWPVNPPHKGQWRWALMFSLICAWTNGWVNTRNAGDLRRHRAHYDVTVLVRDLAKYRDTSHKTNKCPGTIHYQDKRSNAY